MRVAPRLPLLLLAAAAAACDQIPMPAASPPADYRPELAGTVDHALCLLGFTAAPVRRVMTGHQIVDGTLNGKPASFVLDTGANVSVLHAGYAEEFGLTAQRGVAGAAIGIAGGMSAGRARIESLTIGDVAIRQDHIMTANLAQLASLLGKLSGSRIHGIIGQDVMGEHRAVIDAAKPMLYLQREDTAPAPVPAGRCGTAARSAEGG